MAIPIKYTCRGARFVDVLSSVGAGAPVTNAVLKAFLSRGFDFMREHTGCGVDLTALIDAVPKDGLDHQIKCPKCGTQASVMRTPDPKELPVASGK